MSHSASQPPDSDFEEEAQPPKPEYARFEDESPGGLDPDLDYPDRPFSPPEVRESPRHTMRILPERLPRWSLLPF